MSISLLKHANQHEICWTPEIYHPQGFAAGYKLPTWVTHSEQHIFNSKNVNKQVQIAVHMSPVKTMEMKFISGDEICETFFKHVFFVPSTWGRKSKY